MANMKIKPISPMAMTGSVKSHARTDIAVRDLATIIDEPEARGGTNKGLTPTEMQLAALVGCTNVITQRIAHEMGVTLGAMEIDAKADFDRRGAMLAEEIEVPFPDITLTIDLETDASPDQIERIKADLGRFCPIAKVLRGSGSRIEEIWTARPL